MLLFSNVIIQIEMNDSAPSPEFGPTDDDDDIGELERHKLLHDPTLNAARESLQGDGDKEWLFQAQQTFFFPRVEEGWRGKVRSLAL